MMTNPAQTNRPAGRRQRPMRTRLGRRAAGALCHAGAIVTVGLVGFPFVWMVLTSIKSPSEIRLFPPAWVPWPPHLENYRRVWEVVPFGWYVLNSAIAAGGAIALQAVTITTAAYAFSQIRFRWREAFFLLFLTAMMVPPQVTLVPNFMTLGFLGLLNTYWALTLPFGASAFGTFLVRQAFLSVPMDLVDAAKIDGATHLQILLRVLVPLSRPTILTFLLLSFTWRWNDYLWPLTATTSSQMYTLPVGLVALRSSEGYTEWHTVMAASTMALAPMLLLFVMVQRQFVEGITRSGIQG